LGMMAGGGQTKEILQISTSNRGAIIGKGGSRINEIRNTSGANVKLEQEAVNGKCECVITGRADAVEKAKQMIQEITGDYSSENKDPYTTHDTGRPLYNGGVADTGGQLYDGGVAAPDPSLPPTTAAGAPDYDPAMPPDPARMQQSQQAMYQQPAMPAMAPMPGYGAMPGMPMYGGYGYAGYGQPMPVAAGRGGTDSFEMAQGDVGRMIGKGGQTIKGIRDNSRCVVKVENDDGSGSRRVTLSGDANAIAMARQLIEEATGATLPPPGGAPAAYEAAV